MELLLVVIIVALAGLGVYLRSPNVIGAVGERRVSSGLARTLKDESEVLIDDLILPTDRGTTQIDHIVLSRYGVFVIETKNMSGWIFGGENQARWTQVMRRHKSQFQNPLRQNYHHVRVVEDLLELKRGQVENLVVFVGTAEPKTAMPPNVFWNRRTLMDHIGSQRTICFSSEEVRDFASKLRRAALENTRDTRRAHVSQVQKKANGKKVNPKKCPRCGSELVERKNRKTGQSFLGCSRYPRCRGTRKNTVIPLPKDTNA